MYFFAILTLFTTIITIHILLNLETFHKYSSDKIRKTQNSWSQLNHHLMANICEKAKINKGGEFEFTS